MFFLPVEATSPDEIQTFDKLEEGQSSQQSSCCFQYCSKLKIGLVLILITFVVAASVVIDLSLSK